jgi:hypothetical protein
LQPQQLGGQSLTHSSFSHAHILASRIPACSRGIAGSLAATPASLLGLCPATRDRVG